jgi:hypothetical protein
VDAENVAALAALHLLKSLDAAALTGELPAPQISRPTHSKQ